MGSLARTSVAHSSTAHEGGKPKWAVLLCAEREKLWHYNNSCHFFIPPFFELSASAEFNNFSKSHRIINVEKRLIDDERGTDWVFLVEYTDLA